MKKILLYFFTMLSTAIFAQSVTMDPTFGNNGFVKTEFTNTSYSTAYAAIRQPDGKIIAGGKGGIKFALSRYNTNGTLDATFGILGTQQTKISTSSDEARIYSLALQQDGKIVAAGVSDIGSIKNFCVVRYTANGLVDSTFGVDGIVKTPGEGANAVTIQTDGKIIVAGKIPGGHFGILRYNTTGYLDSTFGTNGVSTFAIANTNDEEAFALHLLTNGKILVAGQAKSLANYYDFALAKLNTDGSLDNSFGTGGFVSTDLGNSSLPTDVAKSIAVQPDGKIILVGYQSVLIATVRYNADGSLDNTFGNGGKVLQVIYPQCGDEGHGVAVKPDGKIIVGGKATDASSGYRYFVLLRYNTNGSIDSTFGTSGVVLTSFQTGSDQEGNALLIQPDNKIILAGSVQIGSSVYFGLARYIPDLNVDIHDNPQETHSLLVYPNPASGLVQVSFNNPTKLPTTIQINNMLGQMVAELPTSGNQHIIDISQLPAGNYIVAVKNEETILAKQLIIE